MRKYSAHIKHRHSDKTSSWRMFLWGIFFFLLLIFGINEYRASKFLTQNQRLNLILNSNPTLIISFSNEDKDKQIILVLPENTYLPVSYGYGNYKIESLWQLSNLEKKPQIYTDTLADILGLPMHFYINKLPAPVFKLTKDSSNTLNFIKENYSFQTLMLSDNKMNLNLIDKLIMSYKLFTLKSKDIDIYTFTDVPYLVSDLILPDSMLVKVLNQEVLDTFMGQKFEDNQVRSDGLTIEVQNNTNVSKIGQKFSRYLTINGAKVIATTNNNEKIPVCQSVIKKTNSTKSIVNFLVANFGCQIVENNDNLSVDVLVKLGEAFGLRWPD